AVVETDHVLDCVDRESAPSAFSENAVRIAVDPIESRTIERRAEPVRPLMTREIVETLVCVFSQHQTREQTRRFFGLRNLFVGLALFRLPVFLEAFYFAHGLEIHLPVGAGLKVQLRSRALLE